jgi:1-acyl-sn-glycerol-3-phosphate acyltransferases
MLRLVVMIIRVFFYIPGWLFNFHRFQNTSKYSLEERYHFIYRFVKVVVRNLNVKVETSGAEKLPKENGYLLTPNHQGLFDSLIIVETHTRPVSAVVKKELLKVPIVKQIILILEAFPIDRSNLRGSMKVIKATSKGVEAGKNYIVFPEGTRSKNGNKLGEFKGGSFKIVIDAKAPIVPVALINCFSVLDKNSLRRVNTEIHYLDPIYEEEYSSMSSAEIALMVQKRIEDKIEDVQRNK